MYIKVIDKAGHCPSIFTIISFRPSTNYKNGNWKSLLQIFDHFGTKFTLLFITFNYNYVRGNVI